MRSSEQAISDITDINYYINMDEKQIIKTSLYRKKGNCILKYRSPNINICPSRTDKSQIFSTQFIQANQRKNSSNQRSSSLKEIQARKSATSSVLKSSILTQLKDIIGGKKQGIKKLNEKRDARESRSSTSMTTKVCLLKTRKQKNEIFVMLRKKSQSEASQNYDSLMFSQPKLIGPRRDSAKSMCKSLLLHDGSARKVVKESKQKLKGVQLREDRYWKEAKMGPWGMQDYIDSIN